MTVLLIQSLLFSFGAIAGPMHIDSAQLTIEFNKVQEVKGHMFIAVYSSEDSYMDTDKAFTSAQVEVTSLDFNWTCSLPKGEYAIVVFHDIDDNSELNTSRLGLPKEPYGFSNDAKGLFGPPSFDQAKVELDSDRSISITLK